MMIDFAVVSSWILVVGFVSGYIVRDSIPIDRWRQ